MPGDGIRILLIEDDPGDARLVREIVAGSAGRYRLGLADSLAAARLALRENDCDIVMTDLDLPDSTGWDTLRAVLEAAGERPVVVLTGRNDDELAAAAVSQGAQDYLNKDDLSERVFARTVRYALDRREFALSQRRNQARLEMIVRANIDGMIVLNREGGLEFANPAARTLLGGRENTTDWTRNLLEAASNGSTLDFVDGDGRKTVCDIRPVEIEWEGRPCTMLALRDVTARVEAEANLKARERFLSMVVGNAPVAIWTTDTDGHITFAEGRNFQSDRNRWDGYLGHPLHDLLPDQPQLSEAARKVLAGQEVDFNVELGEAVYQCRYVPLLGPDGAVTGGLGVATDVTERVRAERARQESEQRYRAVFENSTDGISIYERFFGGNERRLIDCNEAYVRMSGRSKEELFRVNDMSAFQVPMHNRLKSMEIQRRVEHGLPYKGMFSWVRPDNRENYIEFRAVPIRIGHRLFVYGIDRDITARVFIEKALRESEAKFRVIFENAPLGIAMLDMHGRMVRVNPRFAAMHGYSAVEMLSMRNLDICHPEDKGDMLRHFHAVLEGETGGSNFELRAMRRDGTVFFIKMDMALLRDPKGMPVYFLVMVEDITARRNDEMELGSYRERLESMVEARTHDLNNALSDVKDARDKLDAILKSVGDGLIVTDNDGKIVLMNRAAEDLLGIRFGDVAGTSIALAIPDRSIRNNLSHSLSRSSWGSTYAFDFEHTTADGSQRIIQARTALNIGSDGVQTGIVTIMHDVTRERGLDRMKTEFLSTAAHELRTPLTSIQGFSELLITRQDLTQEERVEFQDYIHKQAVGLGAIISDLLDVSRIESGKGFSLHLKYFDLDAMIRRKIEQYRAQTTRHDLVFDAVEGTWQVYADAAKMEQVMDNIMTNAIKYSPDGGEIAITLENGEVFVRVAVRDHGMGMTQDQLSRIYEKFYRGKADNTAIPGTGLGMSIVKYIVEAHGGTIDLESELGRGTSVSFTVPKNEEAAARARRPRGAINNILPTARRQEVSEQ